MAPLTKYYIICGLDRNITKPYLSKLGNYNAVACLHFLIHSQLSVCSVKYINITFLEASIPFKNDYWELVDRGDRP